MKNILLSVFIILGIKTVYSQPILMKIDKDTIYTDDFVKQQKKSLELIGVNQTISNFIDFNLLKQYARSYNVEKSPQFETSLIREGDKLKDSLYYRPEYINPLLLDYFNKIQTEKKVQILIFKENILPANADKKQFFIHKVVKDIKNDSKLFSSAVEKYSMMQDYKFPKYFDIFSLDKFLIDEIYKAPLNKTHQFNYGEYYYLILVSKERKYLGETIFDGIEITDLSVQGKEKAQNIFKEIKTPEDFSVTKIKLKADKTIKESITNKSIQDEVLYNEIVNSDYPKVLSPQKNENGYVIYLYKDRYRYDDFNKIYKRIYKRLINSNEINTIKYDLIKELTQKLPYKFNRDLIEKFYKSLPKTYEDFEVDTSAPDDVLIDIGKGEFQLTVKSLNELLQKNVSKDNYDKIQNFSEIYLERWFNEALIEYYDIHYFEFERYKDSWNTIKDRLLIKAALSIITNQAIKDVEGQKKYLDEYSKKYTWNERIYGDFYYCLNDEVLKDVIKLLKENKSADYIKNIFKDKLDDKNNTLLIIDNQGKLTRDALNLPKNEKLHKKVYITDYKERKLVVDIKDIKKDDKMTLEEFQAKYIEEYIDYMIGEKMKDLKNKAKIEINNSQETILMNQYSL